MTSRANSLNIRTKSRQRLKNEKMKTKRINKLSFNKQTISSLNSISVNGGDITDSCCTCASCCTCYTCGKFTCEHSCYASVCYCAPTQDMEPTYLKVTNKFNKTTIMNTTGVEMVTIGKCR